MATAEELLSGRSVSGVDKTLVISNDLRTIAIPSSVKCLGVEYDDDVLELNFKMPRYIGPTDLSPFTIRINYMNAQGEPDIYTVNKPTVEDQNITFSWLVGPIATRYRGDTKFNVCLRTFTGSGEDIVVDREYNTTVASLPVLEGLEVDEGYLEDHVDLLEQWRRELFDAGDSVISDIENASQREQGYIALKGQEVLATIPEDYQTTFKMIDNADRTKSDAIISTVEGEIITVADSSDDYLRGLKVFGKTTQVKTTGKNLLDVSPIVGHTSLINNGGAITVITPSASTAVSTDKKLKDLAPLLKVGETYILTFDSTGTSNYIYLEGDNRLWTSGDSLTITQTMLDSTVLLYASGVSTVAKLSNMMIRSATIADATYEPYSSGIASPSPTMSQPMVSIVNPSVSVYGKNLISCDDIDIVETDGYYHTFETGFEPIVGETYTLSMDVTTNVFPFAINIGCGQYAYNADMTPKISGSYSQNGRVSLTFVWQPTPTQLANNHTKLFIRAPRYGSPTTFNASVSNVQLELGSNATEYEPYRGRQNNVPSYTLPAVPVNIDGDYTDANGQQWIGDEIDYERGVHIQRIKQLTLTGNEQIVNVTGDYAIPLSTSVYAYDYADRVQCVCNYYPGVSRTDITQLIKMPGSLGISANINYIRIADTLHYPTADVAAFRQFITDRYNAGDPVVVSYILAKPIETPLADEEIRWFKFAHTNFPNTTVLNDAGAMVQLKYNVDTKTYLENCFCPTDEQVQASVDAWLSTHFTNAEEVSF